MNEDDRYDHFAADIIDNLTRHSYHQGDPREEMFFLAWSNVTRGTVLSCEDIQKNVFEQSTIESFDLYTGDVTEKVTRRETFGEPHSYEVRLMDLFVKNFYIRDVQEQPALIHETYYADKERFDTIFGRYPNAKLVKDLCDIQAGEHDTYFHKQWGGSVKSNKGFLVSRYMNKYRGSRGCYRIVANGVELYNGPMPWVNITRRNYGKPAYPIAKTIYEPFADADFIYGN